MQIVTRFVLPTIRMKEGFSAAVFCMRRENKAPVAVVAWAVSQHSEMN
jgi:hypothetical protein